MSIQAVFLVAIVALITIFDIILIVSKGKRNSISAWAIRTSYKYPSVVLLTGFMIGYVLGHTTWVMKPLDIYECKDEAIQKVIKACYEK